MLKEQNIMNLFSSFKKSKINWSVYTTAFADTLLVGAFTMLPLILGLFYLLLKSEYTDLSKFYQRGEFFLYALSLTVSSYLVYNQFKVRASDLNSLFGKISLLVLVICSGLYAVLTSVSNPNVEVAKYFSIILMAIALPLFFYAQVISSKQSSDVAAIRRDEQDDIMKALK